MTAATWFDHEAYWEDGTTQNDCGIKAGHAYSLIAAFELKNITYGKCQPDFSMFNETI